MKKKLVYILLFLFIILVCVFLLNKINTADVRVKSAILKIVPEKLLIPVQVIYRNQIIINHRNAYKQSILPENNYDTFSIETKKLNISEGVRGYLSFYISIYKDKLYLVDSIGNISYLEKNNLLGNQIYTKNNLNITDTERIIDAEIINNEIFISAAIIENGCPKHKVLVSDINTTYLTFKEIFSSLGCAQEKGKHIQSGRIINYELNGVNGILISSSDSDANMPNLDSQNKNSSFGKIIFIDPKSKKSVIFSTGLRNVQGLKSLNKRVFLTEHGPEGGDELNEAEYGSNFGWPYSSYGSKYTSPQSEFLKNHEYFNSHREFGFKEPIYAFVPSVGVSELILLNDEFYPQCKNCILLSTLNSRSLFFLRMSSNYNRVIFSEKILVGERIRDMTYDISNKSIYLALEESGSLMKLTND